MTSVDRRSALVGGAAGAVLFASSRARAATHVMPASDGGATMALFDDRYADARRFASAAGRLGARPIALGAGGPIELWSLVAGVGVSRVIGLTTYADRMVLLGLAKEAGARLVFDAEHDGRGAATIAHKVRTGGPFAADGAAWAERLAAMLLRDHDAGRAGPAPRGPGFPGTLCSWAIGFGA